MTKLTGMFLVGASAALLLSYSATTVLPTCNAWVMSSCTSRRVLLRPSVSPQQRHHLTARKASRTTASLSLVQLSARNNEQEHYSNAPAVSKAAATVLLGSMLLFLSPAAQASAASASGGLSTTTILTAASDDDAVEMVIQKLRNANGQADATVKVYEEIAEIITEGKGVGGNINFQGVQLDRGYIADEDTAIYNPGLSLLTETEKQTLVKEIVKSKQQTATKTWNADAQAGYDFLREKLDPLHMYELSGYLKIVPFYGAILYLAAIAVQQLARDLFPVAYILGVVAFFGPAVVLVLLGPQ